MECGMKRLNDATLGIVSRLERDGNAVRITDGQLDRKQYMALNDVLEAMGGKWNKKAKAHLFDADPSEAIDAVLLTGQIATLKSVQQEFGFFPTPSAVVDTLIELAEPRDGMRALEPSAGKGAIAFRLVEEGMSVDCIEILPENAQHLINAASVLNVIMTDFLNVTPRREYDRVVMNPPFARQQDIDHVLHALKFVKEGGRLVSVMSSSVTFRENKKTKEFRAHIDSLGGYFQPVDDGAFKESGTMVRTVILRVNV